MTFHHGLCILVLSFLISAPSLADTQAPVLRESDLSQEAFPAAADAIRQYIEAPGAHAYSSAERRRIEKSLDRIATHLQSDRPSAGTRIKREQVRVNEALLPKMTQASVDSEVICRRESRVGSNIPQTICRTREEMELEREQARQTMDRFGTHNCVASLDSGGNSTCLGDD